MKVGRSRLGRQCDAHALHVGIEFVRILSPHAMGQDFIELIMYCTRKGEHCRTWDNSMVKFARVSI